MDKWIRTQDLVEDVFGKRPETPEMLIEYMIIMADMIIDDRDYNDYNPKPHPQMSIRH